MFVNDSTYLELSIFQQIVYCNMLKQLFLILVKRIWCNRNTVFLLVWTLFRQIEMWKISLEFPLPNQLEIRINPMP